MANKIQIKRKTTTGAGSQLAPGELAYNYYDKSLYIGNADGTANVRVVKGEGDFANYVLKSGDTMTGPLTLSGNPVNYLQAATKQYVDSQIQTYIQGLDIRESVVCATTPSETLSDWTYSTGAFTAPHNGVGSIDGVTFTEGMRVLVKNRPGDLYNNIYTVTKVGDATHKAELKQVESFFDSLDAGIFVFVEQGTINQNTGWVISQVNPVENKCIWTQFSGAGAQALATLSDVTLTNPALNHILYHNGTKWVNLAPPDNSSQVLKKGTLNLEWTKLVFNDIDLVSVTSPAKGNILWYNGTSWVNLTSPSTVGYVPRCSNADGTFSWSKLNVQDLNNVVSPSGNAKKLVKVNDAATGYDYLSPGSANYYVVRVNSDHSGFEVGLVEAGVINNSTGHRGALLKVRNESEAMDYTKGSDDGQVLCMISDTDLGWSKLIPGKSLDPGTGNNNKILAVSSAGDAVNYTDTIDCGTWS